MGVVLKDLIDQLSPAQKLETFDQNRGLECFWILLKAQPQNLQALQVIYHGRDFRLFAHADGLVDCMGSESG